jgi:hypothetical protein
MDWTIRGPSGYNRRLSAGQGSALIPFIAKPSGRFLPWPLAALPEGLVLRDRPALITVPRSIEKAQADRHGVHPLTINAPVMALRSDAKVPMAARDDRTRTLNVPPTARRRVARDPTPALRIRTGPDRNFMTHLRPNRNGCKSSLPTPASPRAGRARI